MLSILLTLSFPFLLFLFFVFVSLRWDFLSACMLYILIFWLTIFPFIVIILEESKNELNPAKTKQRNKGKK